MKEPNLELSAKSDLSTIRQHTDDLLKNAQTLFEFGYIQKDQFKLLKLACEYHDYGKINDDFQKRLKNNTKFDEKSEIPHNILSVFFINKESCTKEDYPVIFNAVLNHHHHCNNIEYINNKMDDIKEKLKDYELSFKVRAAIRNLHQVAVSQKGILIKGLLHKCDYCASAGIEIEYKNNFLENCMQNLIKTWQKKDPTTKYNDMQLFCEENSNENIIITAPTGMGKTEASLLWLGNSKGFYVLPIRTAINCIYDRIARQILNEEDIEHKISLLHSSNASFLMDNYEDLELFDYLNLSKNLTLPLTVTTPDQIFDFVFRYKGYEIKPAILSYSKVIIDEIQSYSPDLLAYIIYGIHEIVKMGGKFSIFTATLSPFILDLLNKSDEINYIKKDFTHNKSRHNIKIIDNQLDIDFIYDKFCEHENQDSNKTLIVCNTVKKAQDVFCQLKQMLPDTEVHLLHSKFTQKDRAKREKEILKDGETAVKKSVIWVATQIIEASVDIDFDYIFTELSDLNSLFQRLGRCNRKGLKDTSKYNCFVFTEIDAQLFINKTINRGFIDKGIFDLSKEALQNIDGILDEQTKNNLLNEYFTFEKMKETDFINDFNYYYNYLKNLYINDNDIKDVEKKFRNILTSSVIPENVYNDNEDEISENLKILKQPSNKFNNKKELFLKKEQAKKIINGYCVNIYRSEKPDFMKEIELSRFQKIKVVKCEYDEKGYISIRATEKKNNTGLFL